MFALDTNTIIYYFKGMGRVAERLLAVPPRDIAIPSVVLFELQVGIAKSRSERRSEQLAQMIDLTTILPFGAAEAQASSKIRADLESHGMPIGPLDNLIAGTALAHGATLVTRNLAEFERIPALSCVDWYA